MSSNVEQRRRYLLKSGAPTSTLRALSESGQDLAIYEEAAESVREARVVKLREVAVDQLLTLPAMAKASEPVRTVVKVMAQDAKRGELQLGVRLLRAYSSFFTDAQVRSLKLSVSNWAKEGESHIPKKDLEWLVSKGYATKKSGLFELVWGRRSR